MEFKIDLAFLKNSSEIIGSVLSGPQINKQCLKYAYEYSVHIPYPEYPFPSCIPNKRVALLKNLQSFSPQQQFKILKELCDIEFLKENEAIKELKVKLVSHYNKLNEDTSSSINVSLISETKHWLSDHKNSLVSYQSALSKYNNKLFQRNLLDDLRLSFEILLKDILQNDKSLENQQSSLGTFIKKKGGSTEFSQIFWELVKCFSKYQNDHIKHNDNVVPEEIEFIFELTSSFMKHLVKISQK